jgi:hypothetical protein
MFTLGMNKKQVDKKNQLQKGEDRLADTLAMVDSKKDAKRDRENYAVNLRK